VFLVYLCRYLFCKAMTPDVEFMLGDTMGTLRPRMRRPASYAEACEAVTALEAAMADDAKAGEAYAHDLLHTTPEQRAAGGAAVGTGDGEGDDGGGDVEPEEGGDAEDEEDATAKELADVERQLAELNASYDEEYEGGGAAADEAEEAAMNVAYVPERVQMVSAEEEDEFAKMMAAMMSDAKKSVPKPAADSLPRDPLSGIAGVLKSRPRGLCAGVGESSYGSGGTIDSGTPSGTTVALRVLRRGAKPNKLEADEVYVPVDDALAKTVIRADERANEERQRLKRQILASQAL